MKKLHLKNEQQKPFIAEKQSEMKELDAEYLIVNEKQESFKQEKEAKVDAIELKRIITRVQQSRYFIQDQVVFHSFDISIIVDLLNNFQGP